MRSSAHGPNRGQRYGLETNFSIRRRRLRGGVRAPPLDLYRILGRLWRAFLGPGERRRMPKPGSKTPSSASRSANRDGDESVNKNPWNAVTKGAWDPFPPFPAATALDGDGLRSDRAAADVFTAVAVRCLIYPAAEL